MMQETNNFETIISSWRRMSAEQAESVTVSMSGDSPDYQLHKKKDEEASLLVPEKMKGPIATVASAGAVPIVDVPSDLAVTDPEEKHLIHEKEETKDAAGDSNNKEDVDYLENNDVASKIPTGKPDKSSDIVDSVIVHPCSGTKPPPSHSTNSNPDEDDCIIKCLYYTIQCCDCVLM